jgi:hypothetical protein
MSKYLRMQSTAARLIKENGAQFKFRKSVDVSDPVAGTVTEGEPLEQLVYAVVLLPGSQVKSLPVEELTGENLQKISKMNNLLISPITPLFRLTAPVEIEYEGEWWRIDLVSPLKPDGKTIILYKAFMQRP